MEAYRQYKQFIPPPELSTSPPITEKPDDIIWVSFSPAPTPPTVASPSDLPVPSTPLPASFSDAHLNPQNWSTGYKAWVIALLAWLTLSLTFASSASAATEQAVMDEFGCGQVPATLTTGAFLIGMGMGAMPAGPLSELFGRLPVYAVMLVLATLFELASALAPNIAALCILRFLAGFMSAAPLSNAGGSLNDIGNPVVRTITLPLFATTGFVGPVIGPIVGGFIVQSKLGWRWVYYIMAIWNALCFLSTTFLMPETNAAALLRFKAARYRQLTGDKRYRAPIEEKSLVEATKIALMRPFMMLAVEPVVQFFVTYLSIVYVCLYGFFEAYPLVMATHGLTNAQTGLTYIPILVGFFILLAGMGLHYRRYVGLAKDAREGKERWGVKEGKVEPEERLLPLMINAILLPASMFWFAWTSPPRFSIWTLMMSGIPFGLALLTVFQASYQYMIDAYGQFAASALAGATLVRYVVSGVVILGVPAMYENLGYEWATSLLAFLGLAMVPVPYVFYIYGRQVRARCRFTVRD